MKEYFKAASLAMFIAGGFMGLAMIARRVDARERESTACIYEAIAKGDSLMIGWAPSCTPPLDVRTEEHEYVMHWLVRQPCGVVGVFVLPDAMTPVVDTFPALCNVAKTDSTPF